jgi:GT2 family glycosyltransferase
MQECESEYIAYCDHDVVHHTEGWDELMASTLDRYHELGIVFPNGGAYPIPRAMYTEILWGVGCNWMLPRRVAAEVGGFDPEIGHHEEVDYQTRLRLAGYKIAALPQIQVQHMAVASSDPASQDRISKGVVNWVNKWVRYFAGQNMSYFASNVLRHEDWPTSALYLEQYFLQYYPDMNKAPDVVVINGQEFDLIRVPRLKGFYRSRII